MALEALGLALPELQTHPSAPGYFAYDHILATSSATEILCLLSSVAFEVAKPLNEILLSFQQLWKCQSRITRLSASPRPGSLKDGFVPAERPCEGS